MVDSSENDFFFNTTEIWKYKKDLKLTCIGQILTKIKPLCLNKIHFVAFLSFCLAHCSLI